MKNVFQLFSLVFGTQIRLVWLEKWTAGSCLFLLNRYMPFADLVLYYQGMSARLVILTVRTDFTNILTVTLTVMDKEVSPVCTVLQ